MARAATRQRSLSIRFPWLLLSTWRYVLPSVDGLNMGNPINVMRSNVWLRGGRERSLRTSK
jgi:hypothetical protein